MVVLLTDQEGQSTSRCAREGCKATGNMLKCSSRACKRIYHVTCANFKSEDEALNASEYYCDDKCAASSALEAESALKKLENKVEAQKLTISKLIDRHNVMTRESKERQQQLNSCITRIQALENENKKMKELEAEIVRLKAEHSDGNSADTCAEENHEQTVLENLFENEDDEDFKRRLTEVFAYNPINNPASHVLLNKPATVSSIKSNVDTMNETQKLAYYQRLHVQRMEAPKLMKFEGDPAQWLSFKANFERMREKGEYDNEAMIEKLREALGGEAEKFVRQRLNQPYANAENILDVLKRKFFQPKEAVGKVLVKLENWHQIPDKNRKELEAFLFEVDNYIYLCENLGFDPELEVAINSRITSKLPYNIESKWCTHVDGRKIKGTFRELSEFMWSFVPNLPNRELDNTKKFKTSIQVIQPGESSKAFSSKRSKREKFPPCWHCGEDKRHYLSRCEDFKKLGFEEKTKFLSNNKICSRCLSSNQHTSANCPSTKMTKCSHQNCNDTQSHCTIMHPPGDRNEKIRGRQSQNGPSSKPQLCINHNGSTFFKIVPVYVIDSCGRKVETTLLMDRAAGASLVTREFFDQLAIEEEPCTLELTWLQPNATHNNSNATLHDLTIVPKHDPDRLIKLRGLHAINNVSLPKQEQDPSSIKDLYPHLREADIPGYKSQRPQILLGLPHAKWMVSLETIMDFASDTAPIAERTPLGWTICGGLTPRKSFFHVCEVPDTECSHESEDINEVTSLDELHQLVKHFNSIEMLGLNGTHKIMCKNDERAIEIRNSTMKRVGNRYEVGLYWNNDNCTVPDNYHTALKRLRTTEIRLKQLGMMKWANDHHKLLRDSGFVREATDEDLNPEIPHPRVNYLIGFVTFNMNKQPPKPRWVMDAASKHQGISLNSVLLKGPDNLIPLTQALFHFRERKYATVCYAVKMYHQILIRKEDQQSQRFLWRDCDDTKEPKIYIFQTMVFGLNSAPSQANDVRIDHSTKSCTEYSEASRVALNLMYMDDAFNSEDTLEEAVETARQTMEMFKEISWDMVDFRSNCTEVLSQLPVTNVDGELLVDLSSDDEVMSRKVLGMIWDVKNDIFVFQMINNQELLSLCLDDDHHPTKKEVLSFIMRIFDCLGLISHFVIRGKMILQDIWRRGIGWNQHIPDDIHEAWKKWLGKFEEIVRLKISRHYKYHSRVATGLTLHVFVDASLDAYAAVAFFRFVLDGIVHVAQVMAKCRVAPVKYTSVPRLELMAALIGARMQEAVKTQHCRMKIHTTTFWTDSVTVLRWLYAPHLRLQQFVAPRVSEIQEITNVNDWRYVPSSLNVSDDGTKWNDIDFSLSSHRWFTGPEFLYLPEDEWPAKFPADLKASECKEIFVTVKKTKDEMYLAGIFSSIKSKLRANWLIYRSIVGWILRFSASLIARIRGSSVIKDKFLHACELYDAENLIFKNIQKEVFERELLHLTRGRGVAQSSKIYSLNPFLDSNGMIRARTRMYADENIPYDMNCPPILPNKHETIHAFLQYLHDKNKHIGNEALIAEARSRAWIIHARKAVKRVKHQCVTCIEARATHQVPPQAPLPSYRLDASSKAFEHCGADCFGPFTIYSGLSRHKRDVNVVIFTCMTTRAVYLRKLDHMSADEMMLAIHDVWMSRGPIRHMYSDNGRNFLGASNIIKDEYHRQLAAEKRITWHFSPPLTPHWGGVWERLIKDIKKP